MGKGREGGRTEGGEEYKGGGEGKGKKKKEEEWRRGWNGRREEMGKKDKAYHSD